jgi:hypothetical protein
MPKRVVFGTVGFYAAKTATARLPTLVGCRQQVADARRTNHCCQCPFSKEQKFIREMKPACVAMTYVVARCAPKAMPPDSSL